MGCKDIIRFAFLFTSAVAVVGLQQFAEVPSYTEVNPGEDALLSCRITDKRGICSWQKDNKPVGVYRGKYEWASRRSTTSGDCSLWIRATKLQIDDGQWRCQITSSNYDVQDALSSPAAALVVRVAPQPPRIFFNGSRIMSDQRIPLVAGTTPTVVCEVRHGNPPAYIEWYLEKKLLTASSQTNVSEVDTPRVWASRSKLKIGVNRSSHRKQLNCRAHHPSYQAPYYRNAYVMLEVTFIPVVSIVGADATQFSNLEEGLSAITLHCLADGNPRPYAWWTKDGERVTTSGPDLVIVPVMRIHSGIYGCQAKNSMGTSETIKIKIDVKFAPRITWVGPRLMIEANLYSQVTLECRAKGNPLPSYQWYHCPGLTSTNKLCTDGYMISSAPYLHIFNVSYTDRGLYVCVAKNFIGLDERTQWSKDISVKILGPPVGPDAVTAHGWKGYDVKLQTSTCADPPPTTAHWSWDHLRLDVPAEIDRYEALEKESIDECYLYTLSIRDLQFADAGDYILRVENKRGFSLHIISLTVHETVHVAPLIATALVTIALLLLLLCLTVRYPHKRDTVDYKIDKIDDRDSKLYRPNSAYTQPCRGFCIHSLSAKTGGITEGYFNTSTTLQARAPKVTLQPNIAA